MRSKECEVLLEMIEEREVLVRSRHREIDALYEEHDWQAKYAGVGIIHESINDLYKEILLLKTVLLRAED